MADVSMPFDPNITSLDDVIKLVQDAGAPNGGIALDFWHLGKLGVRAADLRRIPAGTPLYVEMNDGQVANMDDPVAETTQNTGFSNPPGGAGRHRTKPPVSSSAIGGAYGVSAISRQGRPGA